MWLEFKANNNNWLEQSSDFNKACSLQDQYNSWMMHVLVCHVWKWKKFTLWSYTLSS